MFILLYFWFVVVAGMPPYYRKMQKDAHDDRKRAKEPAREVVDLGWSYPAYLPGVEGLCKKWIDSPPKCYSSDSDVTVEENFKGKKHVEKKRRNM
jgi:hypothetical protein